VCTYIHRDDLVILDQKFHGDPVADIDGNRMEDRPVALPGRAIEVTGETDSTPVFAAFSDTAFSVPDVS